MSHEYIVQMDGITVQFPGVLALDKVHFDAKPGEVHVLLGENGAGKSTIMKVLAGVNTNYEGRILYKGKEIVARSVDEQRARGVSIIFQEMNLLKNLTVAENMFLGRQPTTRTGRLEIHEPAGARAAGLHPFGHLRKGARLHAQRRPDADGRDRQGAVVQV